MKKIVIIFLALVISFAAVQEAHAFGLGVQANFSAGDIFAPGAALLISPSDHLNLAINWFLDFDNVNIVGLTLDVVPLVLPLSEFAAGSFNFTLGAGLFANVIFTDDPSFNGGLRIPVGFNLMLGRGAALEIFTHVAPSFGLRFVPSLGLSKPFFPVALGIRFWIG